MPLPLVTSRPEKTVNSVLSRWNAANLPLIYDITNTKWPTNSEDSTVAITSVSNDNGFARLNHGSSTGLVAREWVNVAASSGYNGPHQITAVSGNNLTIDFPFGASDTGTSQKYYQNYTTLIRVNIGLDPTHEHAALKPNTLVGTIEQRPDTNNITLPDVRDYVKNKLNTNYDRSQVSWPNDLNGFTDFYISFAERYDLVTAGVVGDFTSSFTNDTEFGDIIYLKAVHSSLQFGYAFGGNMGEYLINNNAYSSEAKWMTFFERSKIIDFNNFDLSILAELTPFDLNILQFDINDNLLQTDFEELTDNDYGVYRVPLNISFLADTTYVTIQASVGGFNVSEVHTIDIDSDCFDGTFPVKQEFFWLLEDAGEWLLEEGGEWLLEEDLED